MNTEISHEACHTELGSLVPSTQRLFCLCVKGKMKVKMLTSLQEVFYELLFHRATSLRLLQFGLFCVTPTCFLLSWFTPEDPQLQTTHWVEGPAAASPLGLAWSQSPAGSTGGDPDIWSHHTFSLPGYYRQEWISLLRGYASSGLCARHMCFTLATKAPILSPRLPPTMYLSGKLLFTPQASTPGS